MPKNFPRNEPPKTFNYSIEKTAKYPDWMGDRKLLPMKPPGMDKSGDAKKRTHPAPKPGR